MSTQLARDIEALIEAEVARRTADTDRPLSVREFARRTPLAASTVYGLVRDGKLRTVASGTSRVLIHPSEVRRFTEGDDA